MFIEFVEEFQFSKIVAYRTRTQKTAKSLAVFSGKYFKS